MNALSLRLRVVTVCFLSVYSFVVVDNRNFLLSQRGQRARRWNLPLSSLDNGDDLHNNNKKNNGGGNEGIDGNSDDLIDRLNQIVEDEYDFIDGEAEKSGMLLGMQEQGFSDEQIVNTVELPVNEEGECAVQTGEDGQHRGDHDTSGWKVTARDSHQDRKASPTCGPAWQEPREGDSAQYDRGRDGEHQPLEGGDCEEREKAAASSPMRVRAGEGDMCK